MEYSFLKGLTILIVEDNLSSRLYLNKILEKSGPVLLNAGDGQEAIEMVSNHPETDIILMDLQLPVLDGNKATKKIREIKPDVIIIAQTAYGFYNEARDILSSGFDDYIIKPILSRTLMDKISVCLSKRHVRKTNQDNEKLKKTPS